MANGKTASKQCTNKLAVEASHAEVLWPSFDFKYIASKQLNLLICFLNDGVSHVSTPKGAKKDWQIPKPSSTLAAKRRQDWSA